jgi:4-hydroxybenzoyl-CoA reductase subunit beta
MERMPEFDLRRPQSVGEAAAMLAAAPTARLLAGGTDLVPNLRRGIEQPSVLVDLGAVPELTDIAFTDAELALGATVTLARLASDGRVAHQYPAIAEAAAAIAGPGHRSVATVGGNLCLDTRCVFYNQSEWWRAANAYCLKRGGDVCHVAPQGTHCHAAFCGDLAPVLLALRADVEVVSSLGTRRIPLSDLYREDGAAHLTIARDEVLARILIPAASAALRSGYRKARARGAMDFPLAGVACALALRDDVLSELRIALTGTNSRPIVLAGTEALLGRPVDDETIATIGKLVQKQVSPMRTTVTQSNYRRQVAAVLAQRLVRELARQEPPVARADSARHTLPGAHGDRSRPSAAAHVATLNAAAVLLVNGDAQRTALVCGTEQMTYGALRDATARAASAWRKLGLARGDRVAIKLSDSSAWVRAFLGTIWAGGVAVAVNPRVPGIEWHAILDNAGFRFILAESPLDTPPPFRERVIIVDDWLRDAAEAMPMPPEMMDENEPAFWSHSSGTSGMPKAVMHAHRFARQIERVSAELLGVRADDRLFASSKLFFAYPQTNCLFAGLKLGATVVLDPEWPTAVNVAATIAAERPTVLFSVPSLYRNLLKEGLATRLAKGSLRLCVSAGEALSPSLREEWRKQTGLTIVNGYGASETLILVLVSLGEGDWLFPSPGVEVESLEDRGDGAPTRIRIKAPTVALGYWNRPDAEATHFRDGAFCPGDLFERSDAGAWRFAGREDSMVKIHGRWVNLIDLEERIATASAGIAEAAAVSVSDADGVDAVAFFYVEKAAAPDGVALTLRTYAETLSHYQRPRWWHRVSSLPRTATGKLIRRRLQELHRALE